MYALVIDDQARAREALKNLTGDYTEEGSREWCQTFVQMLDVLERLESDFFTRRMKRALVSGPCPGKVARKIWHLGLLPHRSSVPHPENFPMPRGEFWARAGRDTIVMCWA